MRKMIIVNKNGYVEEMSPVAKWDDIIRKYTGLNIQRYLDEGFRLGDIMDDDEAESLKDNFIQKLYLDKQLSVCSNEGGTYAYLDVAKRKDVWVMSAGLHDWDYENGVHYTIQEVPIPESILE